MKRKSVFGTLVLGALLLIWTIVRQSFYQKQNQMKCIGDLSYLIKIKEIYGEGL